MDRQESSTGLVIGMIIGGIVVLLLILGGLFGAGWFFMVTTQHNVMEAERALVALDKDLAEMKEVIEADIKAEAKAPMAPGKNGPAANLIGAWEAQEADGRKHGLEIRADGTLELVSTRPGDAQRQKTLGRWAFVEDGAKHITLRYTSIQDKGSVHDFILHDDHNLTIHSERHPDTGAIATLAGANLDGLLFERRRSAPKGVAPDGIAPAGAK